MGPLHVLNAKHVPGMKAILESVRTDQVIDCERFLARWGTAQPQR